MFFPKQASYRLLLPVMGVLLPTIMAHATPVEKTTFRGLEAYRLSEGHVEAVVVPSLSGRVMRYGAIGGSNWLWNAPPETLTGDGYKNLGGDKTFAGPHPTWGTFSQNDWPPDPSWDGGPHQAQVLANGHLRTTGNIWRGFGVRVIRDFSFNDSGEFVVSQTLEKVVGEPRVLCIWPVTQVVPPEAVFVPMSTTSAYTRGFHPFGSFPIDKVRAITAAPPSLDSLLQITPAPGAYYKLGVDAPVAALAAVKDGVAFVQLAAKSPAQYPDGVEGAGLDVEFYNHGDGGSGEYVELELLSPLCRFVKGSKWTHTVRWSLHTLPSKDVNAPSTREAIKELLNP